MKTHNLLNSIAAAVLVAGLALTAIPSSAIAEQIQNNDRIDGVIRRTSPIYRFRNMWTPGTPTEELRGQEYTFSAREGDNIQVFLDTDRSRGFTPVMVLFYGNNKQVAFTQDRSFNYQIPRSGDYKLLVLAKDAARGGSYTVEVSGIDGDRRASNRWDDRSDRGRDSRSYDGERILRDDFGLRPVDCRDRRSIVRVRFDDAGRDGTYCAVPTRAVPAGDYYYNSRTRDLDSARLDDGRFDRSNDNSRFDPSRDQCRVSVGGVCVTR
ncbi:MAG: hypothetical protein JGK17_15750 [Microcoleus sp. PH2017_10_PVI_O_A]|uniref:hypothetical protein n=1 Tax=unclassified Microcoleus TaxID=2642155 RepID=UPI001D2B8B8C|nr:MULTISPECIES: hypothetical protein [unclassified Microcoleus]TAE84172.1 MAG: hypothetical protein EAZ83_06995 [Oscillatoriales cyanobacterium]MCC3407015.1 hypothetical protein [Microcoleus sp. PH2017_10_PVI_O_A]MCC3459478.1 hypothetical protein [Microcoleus sp. PH2017_11_PCY_U_A]MCC3477915.1 hypothetical protein [Microcoleus sp. PH2017_12_PCY_D_A]MCC3530327.1 hypothetical protein [Microcoleus sp. PH2017_21_RUC_O_A]